MEKKIKSAKLADEKKFKKERIKTDFVISESMFVNKEFRVGRINDDFIKNKLTVQLSAYIYEQTIDERDLVYYCPKPTFFDWLLGRNKRIVFKFKAMDLLLNPPEKDDTERIYIINQV